MARRFGMDSDEAIEAKRIIEEEEAQHNAVMKKVKIALGLGISVLFMILCISNVLHVMSTLEDTEQVTTDIEIAKQTYENKKNEIADTPKQIIEDDPIVNNATEKCKSLCDIQNQLTKVTKKETDSNLGITVEHQKLLQELDEYNLGKAGNVTWSTYGYWYFNAIYDYEGTSLDVAWICYDSNDSGHKRPLAWATATYDAKSDMINNFKLYHSDWYRVTEYINDDYTDSDPAEPDQTGHSGPEDSTPYNPNIVDTEDTDSSASSNVNGATIDNATLNEEE